MTIKTKITNIVIALIVIFLSPMLAVFYLIVGVYDLTRNDNVDKAMIKKYFVGIGIPTWLFSTINSIIDIVCLPYWNKKIYSLNDLPQAYQNEIQEVIAIAEKENVVAVLGEKMQGVKRGMIFFKWYGKNQETDYTISSYHKNFKYIKTIGISIFNEKVSTNAHFGPIRPTLRVLYNINDINSRESYIDVGKTRHYWADEKMFIFDDTLMHQSVNQTDEIRYCMFIDVLRPSYFPWLLAGFVRGFGFLFNGVNKIFYKAWVSLK